MSDYVLHAVYKCCQIILRVQAPPSALNFAMVLFADEKRELGRNFRNVVHNYSHSQIIIISSNNRDNYHMVYIYVNDGMHGIHR